MLAERWQRIESLFAAAAARPAEERTGFLDAHCGDDPELRAEMERLLSADESAGTFIEQAVEAQASALAGDALDVRTGQLIGPYRVVGQLGRGGMSSVYLAVRADEQFRKRVAIKLVRRGMDTDDILRRFRGERQILASLDHPNVARLYDGGTTADALPYFVMEYIEGQPIDAFCDERRLTVRERLILFRSVCAAVHYAHCNLVVHRDLKPSNILVTTGGEPKLLDFGIAKLLNPELADATLAPTGNHGKPMTPGYASPEQVTGRPITTASDVYSLGVLLYELLAGRRPYRVEGREEIERVVCTLAPERPSLALFQTAPRRRAAVSEARGASPEQLRRALSGDLDNIVLMALRKEPARRYGSVEQLAEDLSRHLAGRPVIARQDTVGYRLAKFARRHRAGVAAAVAVAGLAVALVVTLAVQSARVAHERDRARQVSAMLNDLFEIADPGEVRGSSITALELLDRGAERVTQLDDEPDTAMLLDTLARLYEELGLDACAVPLRRRALGIYRAAFAGRSREVADALDALGVALALAGSFAEAEPLFREALAARRQIHDGPHPLVVASLNKLALVLHDLGDFRQARSLYEEGVDLQLRCKLSEEERAASHLKGNLALLHYDMGDYPLAEALYREMAALRRRALGREHPLVANSLDGLGMTLAAGGDHEEAETLLREALAMRLPLLGPDDREVTRSRTNLGRLLCESGRPAAGEAEVRQALDRRLVLIGEHHPEVAVTLEVLALCHAARGDVEQAEQLYRRALAIYRSSLPPSYPMAVDVMLELGHLLERRGECGEAEPLLREALAVRRQALAPGSWQLAEAESALGACLAAQGRIDEARPLLEGSAAPLAARLGPDHARTLRVRARLDLLPK